jgi:AraC family transcriptional regulator of adaptative response/methylated-DNA-[protein]-cysteine methyltransferase
MERAEQTVNYQRIAKAIQYLDENFTKQPDLDTLADELAMSPFHFQRLFSEWVGISPKRFLQYLTTDFLKTRLQATQNLIEAAETAGLSSQSRVYDLFVNLEAVTPQEYKTHGAGLVIEYGFHETLFGNCLIGVTDRGICHFTFIDGDPETNLQRLQADWKNAEIRQNQYSTAEIAGRIFQKNGSKLNLLVRGTNFQVKVWEALLRIPEGYVASYQTIARLIDQPKALQAVGSAVGANPVGFLIPCHRVIRKEGIVGEYHWGSVRKKALLGWEMRSLPQPPPKEGAFAL